MLRGFESPWPVPPAGSTSAGCRHARASEIVWGGKTAANDSLRAHISSHATVIQNGIEMRRRGRTLLSWGAAPDESSPRIQSPAEKASLRPSDGASDTERARDGRFVTAAASAAAADGFAPAASMVGYRGHLRRVGFQEML